MAMGPVFRPFQFYKWADYYWENKTSEEIEDAAAMVASGALDINSADQTSIERQDHVLSTA
jgi:hypothetical protein